MPSIRFFPEDREVQSRKDGTILEAAQEAGIPLTHVCKGNGRCSTCRVHVAGGGGGVSPRPEVERKIAERMGFGPEIRLACQTRVCGDLQVRRLVLDEEDVELTSLLVQEKSPDPIGVEKKILILFADIRGFTSLAEKLLPYDVIHILNRYFHLMNEVIESHGGIIDNYMGDGFMALFETSSEEDDMLRGIRAGLEMLDVSSSQLRRYVRDFFGADFSIGIGLHYGLVVAGTVGGLENKKHTIIGDAVNFASRIESSNKVMGTQFLISDDVYDAVRNRVRVGKSQTIDVPGKTGTHTLYEVVALT